VTTIVCNRQGMAADTRVTSCGPICHEDKIIRVGTSIFGMAGHASLTLVLLEWLRTARNRDRLYKQITPEYRDEVCIIELNPGGIILWDGWGAGRRLNDSEYAIGSGSMTALGLLRKGASLRDSVAGAIGLDECSGAPIQVLELKPRKKR
jgi:20S proteasome alpha/beta subunit